MAFILELIFQIFGEFILQFVFEALAEAGIHLFSRSKKRAPGRPLATVFGYVLLGCLCGLLSLWLFPHFFVKSPVGRGVSLLVTPLLAAGAITLISMWRSKHGEELLRLEKFAFVYVFAFSMEAVRFAFASAG